MRSKTKGAGASPYPNGYEVAVAGQVGPADGTPTALYEPKRPVV